MRVREEQTPSVDIPVGSRYKLQVVKNGEIKQESGWSKNVITNNGMNIVTSALWNRYCQVGSGSTPPTFTDVALVSKLADSNNASTPTGSIDVDNRYLVGQKTFSFLAGAAAGNISEVGVGRSASGDLFSRALVVDSGGSPTSITVLSDEDLIVVWEVWMKQPTTDFTGAIGGNNYTIRAARVDATVPAASQFGSYWNWAEYIFELDESNGAANAYTGAIGTITSFPGGTRSPCSSGGVVNADYVADSHERTAVVTFSTVQANFDIKSFSWVFGPTFWQVEFENVIPKTAVQTLKFGVKLSWSRDSGPA